MINNKAISKWFSVLLLMLVAGITGATAQSLSIGAVSIKAGETADVTVSLAGGPIYGIQTDVVLPAGLTVVDNSIQSLQEGVSADGNTLASGNYRVAVLSIPESGEAAAIAIGEVFKLTVQAAADFEGGNLALTGTELTISSDGMTVAEVAAEDEPTVEVTVEEEVPGVPSVIWAMADGASSVGVASPTTLATDITWSMGSNIKIDDTPTATYFGKTFTRFTNTTRLDNDRSKLDNNYIEFKFTPQGGEFTPTDVTFDITKVGTGDPNIWVYVIDGTGKTIMLGENVTIRKNSESTPSETQTFEVSGATSSTGAVALRIYIGKLATNKQVAIANVVVSGTLLGADDPVLSATKNVALSVTPLQTPATATITLTGKNLTDGEYSAPVINLPGLTIEPESFTVADGEVSQDFTLTYAPTVDTEEATTDLTFTVGDLTATTSVTYAARVTAYEQTEVSEAKEWDWTALSATVELTGTSVPSNTQEFVFRELEEKISFGSFDAQSIVISNTQYPSRAGKFQNGTIKIKTTVDGVITVDFSDTGASGTGVKRYLNVNGVNTAYYTQRDGTSDRKTTGNIFVRAGDVAITSMGEDGVTPQAICIYKLTFTPADPTATPTFTPESGTYTGTQTVELACETDGATIYYTVNGDEPTAESTAYTEPITVSATTTIRAIAILDGVPSEVATADYTIIIVGDATGDGDVTVSDAVLAVNFALGTVIPTEDQLKAADINQDNEITVSDAVGIVNIALNANLEQGNDVNDPSRASEAAVNYLTQGTSGFGLVNETGFVAFQMDVTLSDGALLNGVQLTDRAQGLQVMTNRVGDSTWRIVAFTPQGGYIAPGKGDLLTLDITGGGEASVSRIEFTDASAQAYKLNLGEATGISALNNNKVVDGEAYTLGGTRTGSLKRGVNVVRQADGSVRKVLVK